MQLNKVSHRITNESYVGIDKGSNGEVGGMICAERERERYGEREIEGSVCGSNGER